MDGIETYNSGQPLRQINTARATAPAVARRTQALRADAVSGMDAWGWRFRLGSARRWLKDDAGDALRGLLGHLLVDRQGRPTGRAGAPVRATGIYLA